MAQQARKGGPQVPVRGNAARVLLQPVHPRDLPPTEGNGEARQDGQQTVQHVTPCITALRAS
jgi:hypothetical protein